MNLLKSKNSNSGFSIVEIILAVSLFSFIAAGTLSSTLYGEHAHASAGDRRRATLMADQTFETLRAVRDSSSGFSSLANGTYGLTKDNSGVWTLVPGVPDVVDTLQRTITISSLDDTTREVTTSVCWPASNCTDSVSLNTYFSNWEGNFGTPGGIRVVISGEGHAYVITTNNTLEVYSVSTPTSPTKVGEMNLSGSGPDLPTALFYSNGKVYVTSSDPLAQLQIIDVSTPASPALLGTLHVAINGDDQTTGDGVWADSSGDVFLIAHDSTGTASQLFMVSAGDPTIPVVIHDGAIYTTGDTQTPGGIAVGQVLGSQNVCTTEGGSVGTGYVAHCYSYNFTAVALTEVISNSNPALSPARAIGIINNVYITTPGGKICSLDCSTTTTISSNDIYDMSLIARSPRVYAYVSVPGDINTALKEIDFGPGLPVLITERDTNGTLSGVAYDYSTNPEYIFGVNRTGATLGMVSFAPTPVGITISPSTNIAVQTVRGASAVHCNPTTYPSPDDTSCPTTFTLKNVSLSPVSYSVSSDASWVALSKNGDTIASSDTDTITVSISIDVINSYDSGTPLSEGVHTATLHFTYTGVTGPADITRTVTLTVHPAIGIKVRAQ